MKVLQETRLLQTNGRKSDYQKAEFHIYLQTITDDHLDLYDLVDQILKYFIEWENLNFLLNEATYETMKITGWKYGITFSWNFIVTKAEH